MRIGVVANPVAGQHRGGLVLRQTVETLKGYGHDVEAVVTQRPGEAVERSRSLAASGVAMVISIGGDGTLNEVVNGVYTSGASAVAVGMVAAGRGRDTARTLGSFSQSHLPDPRTWEAQTVDLGIVHSADGRTRTFINGAGFGFDAAVAARATRYRRLPGTIPYFIATAMLLPSFRPFQVAVRVAGEDRHYEALMVMASNCKYVGGGMKVAPAADPSDGLLDFLLIKDMTKPDFAANFLRVYRGTHITHPAVVTFRATSAGFSADAGVLTHIDGEIETAATTRIDIVPGALRWIGPRR